MYRIAMPLVLATLIGGCLPAGIQVELPPSKATAPTQQRIGPGMPGPSLSVAPAPFRPNGGAVTTFEHNATWPEDLAVARDGTLFAFGAYGLYRIGEDGTTMLLTGSEGGLEMPEADRPYRFAYPAGLAVANDGSLWVPAYKVLYRVFPDGTFTTRPGPSQTFQRQPAAVDRKGNLYVALEHENYVWRLTPGGEAGVFAGRPIGRDEGPIAEELRGFVDGPGSAARFSYPSDLAVGPDDALYVADAGNGAIRRISPEGVVSTVLGAPRPLVPPSPPGGHEAPPTPDSGFVPVRHLAVAADGVVYATARNKLLRVVPGQPAEVFAGGDDDCEVAPQPSYALAAPSPSPVCNTDARGPEARFDRPGPLVVGPTGTIFLIDQNFRRIRRIE